MSLCPGSRSRALSTGLRAKGMGPESKPSYLEQAVQLADEAGHLSLEHIFGPRQQYCRNIRQWQKSGWRVYIMIVKHKIYKKKIYFEIFLQSSKIIQNPYCFQMPKLLIFFFPSVSFSFCSIIIMSKRVISNSKSKTKQLETKVLEQQTRKMEQKLADLKKFMDQQKIKRQQEGKLNQSASRWKTNTSTTKAPLKNYAQKILEEQKEAFKKYGVNPKKIAGTKTFKPIIDMIKPPKPVENLPTPEQQPKPETTNIIGDKFGKAKIQIPVSNLQQKSVNEFLIELNLNQYIQTFQENGFDDLELLKDITRDDLEKIGVSTGHQIKIVKNLKRIFGEKEDEKKEKHQEEEKRQVKTTTSIVENQKEIPKQVQKQSEPDEDDFNEEYYDEFEPEPGTGTGFDGEYDEQRNRRQFQEAVLAYRGVYKQIQQLQQSSQIQTEPPSRTPSVCFTCYKSTLTPTFYLSKAFCSQRCLQRYCISITQQCPTCSKEFIKFQGICHQGVRYCSPKCSPPEDHQQMEALFIKWRLEEKQKQKEAATFEDSLEM